jgi:hypothetical protein
MDALVHFRPAILVEPDLGARQDFCACDHTLQPRIVSELPTSFLVEHKKSPCRQPHQHRVRPTRIPLGENSGRYLARRRSRPLLIGLTGLSSTGRNGFRFAALLDGRFRGDGFWIGSKDVFGFFCPASLAGARPS